MIKILFIVNHNNIDLKFHKLHIFINVNILKLKIIYHSIKIKKTKKF